MWYLPRGTKGGQVGRGQWRYGGESVLVEWSALETCRLLRGVQALAPALLREVLVAVDRPRGGDRDERLLHLVPGERLCNERHDASVGAAGEHPRCALIRRIRQAAIKSLAQRRRECKGLRAAGDRDEHLRPRQPPVLFRKVPKHLCWRRVREQDEWR